MDVILSAAKNLGLDLGRFYVLCPDASIPINDIGTQHDNPSNHV